MSHMGSIFIFGYIPSTRTPLLHPSLQPDTKTCPHIGRIFVSAYILSPLEHYQCAQVGTLVFYSRTKAHHLGMFWSSNRGIYPNVETHRFRCLLLFCQ